MRIVLVGAPGSGKGTQGDKLAARHGVPKISTGDLLRAAVAAGTALGQRARAAMEAGQLVADDVVIGMVRERLHDKDAAHGFVLDGFPRSLAQAEALDHLLETLQRPIEKVIHLEVDQDEIVRRMLARGRTDDNEATIRKRLQVYADQTRPLLEYYRSQNKLVAVPGVGDVDAISARVAAVL